MPRRHSAAEYIATDPSANLRIEWTLPDILHTVHRTFELKRGTIRLDLNSGEASGEVVVDAASGDSGGGARDARMHHSVLESLKYPEAVFTPDRVEGKLEMPGTSFEGGMFRIHGIDPVR